MKVRWFPFLVALVFLVGLAQATEKTTLGTPIRGQAHRDLVMVAGEEKGFWHENGLDVKWVPFDSGASLVRAMVAGAVDFTATQLIGILPAVAQGAPLIMVADLGERNDFHVWVRPDSPIKEFKDLRGARIGVAALGGAAQFLGTAGFSTLGIDIEKDVRFVGTGGARPGIAALKAGAIDGWILSFFAMAPLIARGEVRSAVNLSDHLPKDWVDSCLLARLEVTEKAPLTVRRMVRAYFQGQNFMVDNAHWTLPKLKTGYGFSEEGAKIFYNALKFSRDGKINPRAVENVRNLAVKYGLVSADKIPPTKKLFALEFAD